MLMRSQDGLSSPDLSINVPPHIVGTNGDFQYDLATLAFNNGEQLEDFHSRILRLQQEIMLSGEIVSPTRLLLQYMKAFSMDYPLQTSQFTCPSPWRDEL